MALFVSLASTRVRTLCPHRLPANYWHGAAPDAFMEHLAMLESADDPADTTTWLEHVTDAEYGAR
ncbi:hypothetical protein BCE75_1175 [Isoptericola sp. CG 20/1183]|uniref:Uncharacterized protein n=1 Tax=Isoptericola halotolerans TaxID=300560 RepID=A0ABX5EDT2_9MICO|nr:hypothetical protein BCE75_1175 [Isoptericola sp. CG 20/1183]PRZ03185.1 hypothetical protein BCL65_11553 [Isoptericola halotolerans]